MVRHSIVVPFVAAPWVLITHVFVAMKSSRARYRVFDSPGAECCTRRRDHQGPSDFGILTAGGQIPSFRGTHQHFPEIIERISRSERSHSC
jgi:hypothetical protein